MKWGATDGRRNKRGRLQSNARAVGARRFLCSEGKISGPRKCLCGRCKFEEKGDGGTCESVASGSAKGVNKKRRDGVGGGQENVSLTQEEKSSGGTGTRYANAGHACK